MSGDRLLTRAHRGLSALTHKGLAGRSGLLLVAALLLSSAPVSAELPQKGESLGGNLRNAPALDAAKIGSLAEGTPITILRRAGSDFNGYSWFQIRYPGGTGYQWGGILCSEGTLVAGLLQACTGNAQKLPIPTGAWGLEMVVDGKRTDPCHVDPQVGTSDTRITITGNEVRYYESSCRITDVGTRALGIRLTGECSGEGETWPLDLLVFATDSHQLVTIDQTRGRSGDWTQARIYRACSK